MSWAVGYDNKWKRDIGYGVPAVCDHPDCNKEINRGLSYVCGNDIYGGEHGCGLFFCDEHLKDVYNENGELIKSDVCERCAKNEDPFSPKPDTKEWIRWKLEDDSWEQWRDENTDKVEEMRKYLKDIK